ncbi:RDD family protein [Rheinheimera baltica]|uniref:RDD family protein n=1 Tax=Rheinheimera baltica TaxID=67576 RepID=UPI00041DA038|nr:RDD family protein [Rheinheimera baltica]
MNTAPDSSATALKYVGFWERVVASVIDSLLLVCITLPLMLLIYGWAYIDRSNFQVTGAYYLVQWVFPILAIIAFWLYRQATPGKMALAARIVDAKTGNNPTTKQCVIRYIGYYLAVLPLGLGFFWIGWDAKKQGWHDKLAGTVVVKPTYNSNNLAHFTQNP